MESFDSFIERLSSSSPAPGGGAASAMVSIVASSLNQMVASLTLNKKKYVQYETEMNSIIEKSRSIDADLRSLMKEDEEAFNAIMSALKMPKDSDEEKDLRKKRLVEATKGAISVPWKIANSAREVLELSFTLAQHGNKNAITDAACAALFAHSAIVGVLYNVKINLNGIPDQDYVGEENAKMSLFLTDCEGIKDQVLKLVDKEM